MTNVVSLGWLGRYHEATRRPAASALTVLPLALLYGLGLLVAAPDARSGVDVVSGALLAGLGVDGYLYVHLAAALVVVGIAIRHLGRRAWRHALLTGPVVGEAILYGMVMGWLILQVMEHQQLLGPMMIPAEDLDRVVVAAGAGLHEELVFRLIMMPALAGFSMRLLAMPSAMAWGVAAIVSSLAFAGAHHLAGEPYSVFAYTYRTMAGLLFAGLYLWRGFSVAAWTHAAYDLQVLYGLV